MSLTKPVLLRLLARALDLLSWAWPRATREPFDPVDHGLDAAARATRRLPRDPQLFIEEPTATLSQAARRVGVSPARVRRAADQGHIRYVRTPGGHRRVVVADVVAHFLHPEDVVHFYGSI